MLPITVYPGFFKARQERERPRVGADVAPVRVKPTVTHKPSSPRALYAMPIVVIVAAMGTFAAGASIVAAGVTMGAMVVGGAMMVGAAMVIVGTVTDRPNLVKWGGILSLAGGLGAAYLGATGALTAGAAEATTGAETAGYVDTIGNAAEGASAGSALTGPVAPGLLATADQVPATSPPQVPPAPATPPSAAPPPVEATPPGTQPPPSPPASTTPFQTGTRPLTDPYAIDVTANTDNPLRGTAMTTGTPSGFSDSVLRWIRDNPDAAKIAGQGATGMLGSLVPKPATAAEAASAEYTRRRAAMLDPSSSWWRQQRAG